MLRGSYRPRPLLCACRRLCSIICCAAGVNATECVQCLGRSLNPLTCIALFELSLDRTRGRSGLLAVIVGLTGYKAVELSTVECFGPSECMAARSVGNICLTEMYCLCAHCLLDPVKVSDGVELFNIL